MRVVIAGAGSVGASIAKELIAHEHQVLLIDQKSEAVGRAGLQGAKWLLGDACELSVLQEADLESADVVVSATGDDKANLVVSLLAKSEFGVARTVSRVNNPRNDWLFNDAWGVDISVNTPRLMTALVEEAVEVGDVVRLLTLRTGKTAMAAFTVPVDHAVVGQTIGAIDWPMGTVPVAVVRDGLPLTPSQEDTLEGEDEVFFLTSAQGEIELRQLLVRSADE
ncbi:potassium channel family protein [Micrococcoides hystricis]|uniref:Trk system potassium uptake protein TrkA n=1 Tax=Micrococcoides hystricis TaxID=1572761 RepID=A0ABV6P6X0_9MICC